MIVDGYIRVSQVRGRAGASFMSPTLQREQIERWAAAHGHQIAKLHVELDESGGRADRPLLLEMLDRIEAGEIDGVAVAKLDRFGRSLIDGLAAIERIRVAGGSFMSVHDGLDLSTDTGKLVLRIMLSMAEWELDRIRSSWEDARRKAVDRGTHMAKWAPVGYRHDRQRQLVVDPIAAPHISEIFRMRATGAVYRELSEYLESHEVVTSRGAKAWRPSSLANILKNRVYLGELRNGPHVRPNAHPALTDEPTWQTAQKPRMVGPRYRDTEPKLASGLARCAGCGLAMGSGWRQFKAPVYRDYRCVGVSSAGHCTARGRAQGWELEHLIEEAFFTLARKPDRSAKPNAQLQQRLETAQANLVAYRDHPTLLLRLGPERFDAGVQVRLEAVGRAAVAVANDRAQLSARRQLGRTADEWERLWPTMTVDRRRRTVADLIEAVFVGKGTETLAERVWICARGEAPAGLSSRGREPKRMLTFDPDRYRHVTIRPAPPWSEQRIRDELSEFLKGLTVWPSEQEFLTAGRGPLLRQIDSHGGQDAWARRFSIPQEHVLRHSYWTEDRVRASLIEIMCARDEWPFEYEWSRIAPSGLGAAIKRQHKRWAAEFRLPVRHQYKVRRWTPELIDEAVRKLAKSTGTYPTERQFIAAGLGGLNLVIHRGEGHRALSERLSIPPSKKTAGHWGSPASA